MVQRSAKTRPTTKATCKQIAALVFDYLNDELSPRRKRDFQLHLKTCPDCVNFLKTYKKTIQATGTLYPNDMPTEVRDSLWQFLRRKLRA